MKLEPPAPVGAVAFVPYSREVVEIYHGWMASEEMQHLTGSEPLSLEEEYAMQESWANDEDKVTFILCDTTLTEEREQSREWPGRLAGDVNAYLSLEEEDDESCPPTKVAELEVMVAEDRSRRKGMASAALRALMQVCASQLEVAKFRAKIKMGNAASIKLFEQLGFALEKEVAVFEEVWYCKSA